MREYERWSLNVNVTKMKNICVGRGDENDELTLKDGKLIVSSSEYVYLRTKIAKMDALKLKLKSKL